MQAVHILGRKNSGKTTLIEALLAEYTDRGLRVATVKHTSHPHPVDTAGRDSSRLRAAGANPSVFVTSDAIAVFLSPRPGTDYSRTLDPMLATVDLVLIEGDIEGSGPKIEVWREETGTSALAGEREDIAAVITDGELPPHLSVPVWPRESVSLVADRVLTLAGRRP